MTDNNPNNPLDPQQPAQPISFDLPPQAAPYQAPGTAYTPPPPAYPTPGTPAAPYAAPGSPAPYAAPGAGAYQQPVYNANQPTPPGMYEPGAPGAPVTPPYGVAPGAPVAPNYGVAPGGMYPPVPTGGIGQPASAGLRFLAALIDGILVGVVTGILTSLFNNGTLSSLISFAIAIAYWAYFNGQGQTVGKMVMKTKVVDVATGQPIGMQRAAIRGVVQLVFGFLAGLPYLSIFMNPQMRGWHDQVANDVVIRIG